MEMFSAFNYVFLNDLNLLLNYLTSNTICRHFPGLHQNILTEDTVMPNILDIPLQSHEINPVIMHFKSIRTNGYEQMQQEVASLQFSVVLCQHSSSCFLYYIFGCLVYASH